MQVNVRDQYRLFYEYAFYDIINKYNQQTELNGKPPIMTSEGRYLRKELYKYMKDRDYSFESGHMGNFYESMNAILTERLGETPYDVSNNAKLMVQRQDFGRMTDLSRDDQILKDSKFIPISPYDPRFGERDVVLNHGSRLGGITAQQGLENFRDVLNLENAQSVEYYRDLKEGEDSTSWVGIKTDQTLWNEHDTTGLARMKKYMTLEEYQKLAESGWLSKGHDLTDVSLETQRKRNAGIVRSVQLLEDLSRLGRDYRIVPDSNFGQIKAELDHTKISVRVSDTVENLNFIGRVYDDGAVVTFSTTYPEKRGNKTVSRPYIPKATEAIELTKHALGMRVSHWDNPDLAVGEDYITERRIAGQRVPINATYHNKLRFNSVIGDYKRPATMQEKRDNSRDVDSDGYTKLNNFDNKVNIVVNTEYRSRRTSYYANELSARESLEEAVTSARTNFSKAVGLEDLLSAYYAEGLPESQDDWEFSSDPEIELVQRSYFDVLSGQRDTLLRPGPETDRFLEDLEDVSIYDMSTPEGRRLVKSKEDELSYPSYSMDPVEIVNRHFDSYIDHKIGQYGLDANNKRFDPVMVATYQNTKVSLYRNHDDMVKMLRMLDIPAGELKGDDFYNDTISRKLVKFDEPSAILLKDSEDPFLQSMYESVTDGLSRHGVQFDESDILYDQNGIIKYKGRVKSNDGTRFIQGTKTRDLERMTSYQEIEGQIGQIFSPNEKGVVYTKFNSESNYAFVPGYEARILPQEPGETLSVEERTRLLGYEQVMKNAITYTIRQDMLGLYDGGELGDPTSLNQSYGRLYDERHDYDFVERFMEQGMEESVLDAIIETEARRVRYSNQIRDNSTIHADYMDDRYGLDSFNDNSADPYVLTGRRNMAILTQEADGYFDPIATTATSTNQGVVRYLVSGASVDSEGRMIKSEIENDQTPLMAHDICRNMKFNPFDRQCMTLSNLMQASTVTKPVNVTQSLLGGWNQEDGIIISKKFAQENQIRDLLGEMRPLVIGDKLSDFHGNKGVVGLVVDPDMDLEEAREKKLDEVVEFFQANPDLDLVMAPFPAVSRYNGGTARELMENPQDLVLPSGERIAGGMGSMRMIVTDKSADAKTRTYDEAALSEGSGRKFSSQLAWALNSKDANKILEFAYGGNNGIVSDLREYLIATGLDIDESGKLRVGYEPHKEEDRKVFDMKPLEYQIKDGVPNKLSLRLADMNAAFLEEINLQGGILELPFELKHLNGDPIPPMRVDGSGPAVGDSEWEALGYTKRDGVWNRHPNSSDQNISWGLPVLSSYLRSGQTFKDGTSAVHDYTHKYSDIFKEACRYRHAQEALREPGLKPDKRRDFEKILKEAPGKAQSKFDDISRDVKSRMYEGKHNIFRDKVMSRRVKDSATAIISADPRLSLDTIGIGPKMAKELNLNFEEKSTHELLFWRDPILHDTNVRFMNVKLNPDLVGVSIHPASFKPFDGDFDGDTVGLVRLEGEEVLAEARNLLSMQANLLNYGSKADDGLYDLTFSTDLDFKVALHDHPELADRYADIRRKVNAFEKAGWENKISEGDLWTQRFEALESLNEIYDKAYEGQCGRGVIRYDTMENHLDSVKSICIDTGAKGSPGKFRDYMRWLGVQGKEIEETLEFEEIQDTKETLASRKDHWGTMYATAVKSFGTGIGGAYSQRGMAALRNECPTAVLELTYPVTQSLLQAKHDPREARAKYELLMGPVRDLWKGHKLERSENGNWVVMRDSMGEPIQDDVNSWKANFKELYSGPGGMNVSFNDKWLNQIAGALSEGGEMRNIEESLDLQAPLDRLAYGGGYEALLELAEEKVNLFEGKRNAYFKPRIIEHNQAIRDLQKEGIGNQQVTGFSKSDTMKESKSKPSQKSFAVNQTYKSSEDRYDRVIRDIKQNSQNSPDAGLSYS